MTTGSCWIYRAKFIVILSLVPGCLLKSAGHDKNKFGNTALLLASYNEHLEIVKFLLKNGEGKKVGAIKTVHVCLDNSSREKMPLPDKLRDAVAALG